MSRCPSGFLGTSDLVIWSARRAWMCGLLLISDTSVGFIYLLITAAVASGFRSVLSSCMRVLSA
jgi:hypothetical protein